MYATAQDWARLAQLFLDDGQWRGEQVLAPGWTEFVTRPTAGSREASYGMGFWLGHPSIDAPGGIYYMNGFQSQYAYVLPEQELVIVRLGATNGANSGTHQLVLDVAAALRAHASQAPL